MRLGRHDAAASRRDALEASVELPLRVEVDERPSFASALREGYRATLTRGLSGYLQRSDERAEQSPTVPTIRAAVHAREDPWLERREPLEVRAGVSAV